jgi:hypothetical protein
MGPEGLDLTSARRPDGQPGALPLTQPDRKAAT